MVSSPSLLHTKLYRPVPRGETLPRKSLTALLDDCIADDCRLVLLSAPTGYGKTTLIAYWLNQIITEQQVQGAWVYLEESEDDPVQFWSYVIAALRSIHPDIGRESLGLLRSAQATPMNVILNTLLNEMTALHHRTILVLDDFHSVQNTAILEGITYWLEHFPHNFHLVIATRSDPFMPLSKLRMRSWMLELRLNDLRFSLDETKAFFFRSTGVNLTDDQAALLEETTEGWPASLQLAALSTKSKARGQQADLLQALQSYNSSDRHLLDFFSEEILQSLSHQIQHFLSYSSIFDRFCSDLCDNSLPLEKSAATMDELERNNLFIIPLDTTRTWYRYHHLFLDLLRQRMQKQIAKDQLREMHQRAGRWFEDNAYEDEAIENYLKGSDYANAQRVLEQIAYFRIFSGEGGKLARWLAAFPEDWRQRHPGLLIVKAWLALTSMKLNEVELNLLLAEENLAGRCEDFSSEQVSLWLGQSATIRATASFNQGDIQKAQTYAGQALSYLPSTDQVFRGLVLNCMADILYTQGQITEAHRYYEQAYQHARSGKNAMITYLAGSMFGNTSISLGQLQSAEKIFIELKNLIESDEIPSLPAYAAVEEGYARLLREWNRVEEAAIYARRALERITIWGFPEITLRILLTLAELASDSGDSQSVETYQESSRKLYRQYMSMWPYPRLWVVEARHLIRKQELDQAEELLRSAGLWPSLERQSGNYDISTFAHSCGYTPAVSLLLARGECDLAIELSGWLALQAKEQGLVGVELHLKLLHSLALWKARRRTQAIEEIGGVLHLGRTHGFQRVFNDETNSPVDLLVGWLKENPTGNSSSPYCRAILEMLGLPALPKPGGKVEKPFSEFTSLSAREVEVLQMVAAGCSNDEIASNLFLSSNTVKTHIKRIFEKLQVNNRLEAVNRARELEML